MCKTYQSNSQNMHYALLNFLTKMIKGSGQKKKTGYFMTSSQIHLLPTHPT